MGDFNDKLLASAGPMNAILRSLPLDNHVHLPTRVTATTSTLLDLLLGDKRLVTCCQALPSDISDHYPIVATLRVSAVSSAQRPTSSRRLRTVNWVRFNGELRQAGIDAFSSTSVNHMLDELYDKVFLVLESHCPIVKAKAKGTRTRPCPWLMPELMEAVRARKICHRKLTRNPTSLLLRDQHRTLRSAAKRLDRLLKNAFFQQSAIRGFYGLSRWTPTSPTFLALGVRPLASAMTNKIVQFVHRCLIGRCSNLFSQYFVPVSSRATRGSSEQLLVVPFWPGPHGRASIQFYGVVTWNALPAALRGERDHSQFCAIIKRLP